MSWGRDRQLSTKSAIVYKILVFNFYFNPLSLKDLTRSSFVVKMQSVCLDLTSRKDGENFLFTTRNSMLSVPNIFAALTATNYCYYSLVILFLPNNVSVLVASVLFSEYYKIDLFHPHRKRFPIPFPKHLFYTLCYQSFIMTLALFPEIGFWSKLWHFLNLFIHLHQLLHPTLIIPGNR